MIKRLWALFTKKRSSQKIFEKKLERLSGGPLTPLHHDHHADKIRELMLNNQSFPDQARKVRAKVQINNLRTPPVREFGQGTNGKYGCSVERSRSDDAAIMAAAMTPVQHTQVHHQPHQAPASGSDVTDGGGSSCDGGGGGCGD